MDATLTFFGTATSTGLPVLGCHCPVCTDAHRPGSPNRRTRPSVLVSYNGHSVLIDTGPDFHAQAVRENLDSLDAVLYTHHHADHILGMDDLRPLTYGKPAGLPLYADKDTATVLERVFQYTFAKTDRYPSSARVTLNRLSSEPGTSLDLFGARFLRVPILHGKIAIAGYRFGSAAYLTDMSAVPESSLPLLRDLDVLILDALRHEPHPTHSTVENSLRLVEKLAPRRAFFTHIGHDLDHDATNESLPPHVRLAHDGLRLTFDIGASTDAAESA